MADAADAKKVLQQEVVAVKQRWGAEAKLQKNSNKDDPNAPLPLAVSRTIQRTEQAQYFDVDDLTIRLWIDKLEGDAADAAAASSDGAAFPVRVEVEGSVPEALRPLIAAKVLARWHVELKARGSGKGWLLEKVLAWAEGAFVDLISLEPKFIEMYEAEDESGRTIRRYAIAEPPPEPVDLGEGDSDSDSDEDDSSEDVEAKMASMKLSEEEERLMRIKLKAEEEADRLWREEKRREHEANLDPNAPAPMSKKDKKKQEEAMGLNQGKRLRKAGAKHNKFDAEAAGKKANKKNGLLH